MKVWNNLGEKVVELLIGAVKAVLSSTRAITEVEDPPSVEALYHFGSLLIILI